MNRRLIYSAEVVNNKLVLRDGEREKTIAAGPTTESVIPTIAKPHVPEQLHAMMRQIKAAGVEVYELQNEDVLPLQEEEEGGEL
jgi:hypothetical protein